MTYPAYNAFYKQKRGEREYGTFEIVRVPAHNSIPFPKSIIIRLIDNSQISDSIEIMLNESECGYIKTWRRGTIRGHLLLVAGIDPKISQFLTANGFLSTVHWENEAEETRIDEDFGTYASISMILPDGTTFERHVAHAYPGMHDLLLNALNELLELPPISNKLNHALYKADNPEIGDTTVTSVKVPDETSRIVVRHSQQSPGTNGYEMIVTPEGIEITALFGHHIGHHMSSRVINPIRSRESAYIIGNLLPQFIAEIRGWITGYEVVYNPVQHSESPEAITIELYSDSDHPYAKLRCLSIGGRNYGNLCGRASRFNDRLTRLVPSFSRRIQELRQEPAPRGDISGDKHRTNDQTKNPTRGGVIFQMIVLSMVVGLIAVPAFLLHSDDSFRSLLLGLIGLAELFGGILFPIAQRRFPKADTAVFMTAVALIAVYIIAWLIWIFIRLTQ